MTRLRLLLSLATACIALSGCNETTTISPPRSEVIAAPTRVEVDGHELTLETHLWRDFQPITPPNGQPLIAVVRVKTVDGRPFPSSVTAERISIVYGQEVWTSTLGLEHANSQPGTLEVVARDGPKWGPHVNVDVVVHLRGSGGDEFLLRAENQPIGRTD
jgi:hypothetical protein